MLVADFLLKLVTGKSTALDNVVEVLFLNNIH